MIRISEKESCCGCSACMNICPKKCISMEADSEGFLYPKVDEKRCVDLRCCRIVCPVQNTVANEHFDDAQISINDWTNKVIEQSSELPEAYAAFIKDSEVRENSTSGGFFTAIAKWIIANGGVVYGVEIDQNCKIVHSSSDNVEQLGKYRGSKYVQSSQGSVYKEIENLLKEERWVLYTGTPCQCAGLRRYLGTKEYATLVVLDVFCHGVGSPKYWDIYVEYNKKKYKADIDRISFREKTYGYNSACMAVYFKNSKSSHKDHDTDLYWTAFSKFYIFRPSCYDCHFKTVHHEYSDFSIGDFWSVSNLGADFSESNGCSLLLVHSEKGKEILRNLDEILVKQKVDIKEALIINGGPMPSKLISSSPENKKRTLFLSEMYNYSINELVKKYIPLSLKQKLKCVLKPYLYKLGILEKIKKYKGAK